MKTKTLADYSLVFYVLMLLLSMIVILIPSCGPTAEQKAAYQAALQQNPDSTVIANYKIKLLFEHDSTRVYRFYDGFDCNCGNGGYFHFTVDLRTRYGEQPIIIPDGY